MEGHDDEAPGFVQDEVDNSMEDQEDWKEGFLYSVVRINITSVGTFNILF